MYRVINRNIVTMDLSDHAPVYLNVTLDTETKRTILRLNTGILAPMREQIRTDIKEYFEENDNGEVSPQTLWDACKEVLREKIIGYSSNLKKPRKAKIEQLEMELKKLEGVHKKTMNSQIKIELSKKINELNDMYSNDIIYETSVMERITFSIRLQQSKFDDIWKQWKMYMSQKHPSFV